MQEFAILFIFTVFSVLLALFMIVLSVLSAPKSENEGRRSIYECGLNIKTDSRIKFQMQFFVYAVLFLIFDIETIFIFPFAISFNYLGMFVFAEIIIFIALLLLGLIYAIKTRMLRFR
ncbi:MAG: NADH-quinone oxidoreductase subunit A [Candidatus Gastranaerophilales bacterium]|nr:NADH-quinone oxidoreductase subunit A [Candidatus Gastranaerophilales bacterium]